MCNIGALFEYIVMFRMKINIVKRIASDDYLIFKTLCNILNCLFH